jgi:7-cyano-7-deazaguanine reductase
VTGKKPQLGASTEYPEHYDPELLVSIPRAQGRASLAGLEGMSGVDIWTGYELSWLNSNGLPQVALAQFVVPCHSPSIVESKSFKLYLNSLNQEKLASWDALKSRILADLSRGFGAEITMDLQSCDSHSAMPLQPLAGYSLDDQSVVCDRYVPTPAYLIADPAHIVEECLYSHVLKTNCPVTGQPDWASVQIAYGGPRIDRAGLLKYLVSFREHQDFHENCVETIFSDLREQCCPQWLSVYARYTRRGGLDINPFRSTREGLPDYVRVSRQ